MYELTAAGLTVEILPDLNPNALISGVLQFESTPAVVRYQIIDRLNGNILAAGHSKSDGKFENYVSSIYIQDRKVYVISFDDTGTYNAQVADLINAVI